MSFTVEVHDSPFSAADLPDILRNLLLASGFTVVLRKIDDTPRCAVPIYVATDADLSRFESCANILDREKFRVVLEMVINSQLERMVAQSVSVD